MTIEQPKQNKLDLDAILSKLKDCYELKALATQIQKDICLGEYCAAQDKKELLSQIWEALTRNP